MVTSVPESTYSVTKLDLVSGTETVEPLAKANIIQKQESIAQIRKRIELFISHIGRIENLPLFNPGRL